MTGAKVKTLDYTGVKDSTGAFRPRRKPEGDYYAHIIAVADHVSKDDNPGWVFTIRVDGDSRSTYPYYTGFGAKELWKSRGLCIAAGMKVPSAKVKLDPNKLVGKAIGIALEDDEYEGRLKSAIAAVMPLDDLDDAQNVQDGKSASTKAKSRQAKDEDDEDDEEDDTPAPAKTKAAKRKPDPVEEDDEDDEEEEDEPRGKKAKKTSAKKPVDDEDDEDEEDEDEDDEPPVPVKKSKSVAKKSKSKRRSDDDDEDDELDIDDL